MRAFPVFILTFVLCLTGCVKSEDTTRLNAEIELTRKQISECVSELKKYSEGAPLYALVALRCSIYRQTLSMLEQKRASYLFYFRTNYQVNGKIYEEPRDLAERLPKLEENLKTAQADLDTARKKAREAGGLMAVMAVLDAETKALTVAQLDYQVSAYRNGYPPYISSGEALSLPEVGAAKSTVNTGSAQQPEVQAVTPSKEQIEADMLKSALGVRFVGKRYRPEDWKAGRYEKLILLEFEYENKTEKEIRAFTGVTVFMDVFDRPFLRVNLTVDDRIPPGKMIRDKERSIKMNEFSTGHKELLGKEMDNIKFRFEPRSILFSDGTRLGEVRE